MPTGLRPLRDAAREFLQQGLQRVMDTADDSLFEMCGRVASNVEQQELFDAMRNLRLKRETMEKALLEGLDKGFREIGADHHQSVMDVLPAGLLSLVSHEELEETVAVKTMVMRSLSENAAEFNPLQQRLQALLGVPVTEDNNPLSARSLCMLMLAALRPLDLKIQVRLILLKLFENHLLKDVGELYADANDILIAAGILPDLQLQIVRPKRAAVRERVAAPTASGNEGEQPTVGLGELRELLGQARGASGPGAIPANALPITQNDLTRLLSLLQRQPSTAAGAASLRQQLDVLLARASANSPRPRVIGKLDQDVITLISMLFEQVLGDAAVPEPLRGPIGDMQVPLLKAAILDQGMFSEQSHPARQLLNEVTVAARDSEELADLQRDRLRGKIEQVSKRLREEFTDDPEVIAGLLEDFSRFTAGERKRAALLEQRLLEAEEAKALRENARQQVDRLLSELLQGLTLPAAIVQGLERGWGGLLQLILLREGESSLEWGQALGTLEELLARVAPLRSREDARLLQEPRRSELFDALQRGLAQVAYDPFEQQRFFAALTDWQRKLLADLRERLTAPALGEAPDTKAVVAAAVVEPAAKGAPAEPSAVEPPAAVAAMEAELLDMGGLPSSAAFEALIEDEQFAAWERAVVEVLASPEEAEPQRAAQCEPVAGDELAQSASSPEVAVDARPLQSEAASGVQTPSVAQPEELLDEVSPPPQPVAEEAKVAIEETHWALVDGLGAGSWVEFCAADGARQRSKLAAFIRVSGQYIFVNRAGVKVATYEREGLAQAFACGVARLMDNAQPFDRALQAIIGNLREMRDF